MGNYAEFENLCFVDTLDNTGFHWVGKQGNLFGVSASDNIENMVQGSRISYNSTSTLIASSIGLK